MHDKKFSGKREAVQGRRLMHDASLGLTKIWFAFASVSLEFVRQRRRQMSQLPLLLQERRQIVTKQTRNVRLRRRKSAIKLEVAEAESLRTGV